jgi:hypothetical protein
MTERSVTPGPERPEYFRVLAVNAALRAEVERLREENLELRSQVEAYREMIREGGMDMGTP